LLLELFGGHSICYFKIFISSEIVRVDYVLFVFLLLLLVVLVVGCWDFFFLVCLFCKLLLNVILLNFFRTYKYFKITNTVTSKELK